MQGRTDPPPGIEGGGLILMQQLNVAPLNSGNAPLLPRQLFLSVEVDVT